MPPETPVTTTDSRPAPRGATRVRIDEGSARGSDLAPGRGSLLRAFGVWKGRRGAGSTPVRAEERRAEPRHDEIECQAWAGWKTSRRFQMNDALIINLSRAGAQIFLDAPPPHPSNDDLWLYLQTPGENAVVKARVLEIATTRGGQCAVGVSFREPCPFAFFEAAVCGLATIDPKTRAAKAPRAMLKTADG